MRPTVQLTIAVLAVASLQLAGCQEKTAYTKVEPAHVEHQEGEEISKLTLTEKAMERLDVQTAPVRAAEANDSQAALARTVVPYSAILYVAKGDAFVYTSPQPRTFIRHPVDVEYIEGDQVVLKGGPPPGTQVVSVGVAELFGTEFGVGH
jgi:outer membrane murein-binding lipoprotein Lpp